jgi:hypothetical protein
MHFYAKMRYSQTVNSIRDGMERIPRAEALPTASR